MWVKATGGALVNLASYRAVRIDKNEVGQYRVAAYYGNDAAWSRLYEGTIEACQQVMEEIEQGIFTDLVFVDLLKREITSATSDRKRR